MKRLLLSILITIIIIFVLLTQISLKDLYILLKNIDPLWAILGSAGYFFAILLRALRYKWLIHSTDISLSQLFRISAFYHLALMVLPSKLGELSFPYLLKRSSGMNMTEGLASLIVSRVYDFFIVLMVFLFTSIGHQGFFRINLFFVISLACLLIGLILIVFFYMNELLKLFSTVLGRLSQWMRPKHRKPFQWCQRKMYEMAEDFSAIKAKRAYIPLTLTSLISWIMIFWMLYSFLRALGVEVSFLKAVFGSTFAVIANALPISGLGNWGLLEAGWAAGFMVVGLSKGKAIATGFGVHVMTFAISVLIGFICWVPLNLPVLPTSGRRQAQTMKPFTTTRSKECK